MSFGSSTAVLALCAGFAVPAQATDGYFSNGYGTQAKGIGGASIAYPKDSLAIASNPAAAIYLGNRADVGVEVFRPDREATISGSLAPGANGTYDGNGRETFLIPELGYVRQLSPDIAVAIAAYGNGGMNTSYKVNPYGAFGSSGSAGVNLEQLFISPTLAYRIAPGHSIGASVNIGYQRFSAKGIGGFAPFSEDGAHLSNKDVDEAFGIGARIGYLGHLTERLSVGATWQSKTQFQEFDKYSGLFADQGGFDAPQTYGVGAAYKLTPQLDVTAEYQRIDFSGVNSVGNPSFGKLFAGKPFGGSDGPGFGWSDVNVFRLGANYQLTPDLQLRGGWAHSSQPIREEETFLNILAPATVQPQFTGGFTYDLPSRQWQVSGYALYAPGEKVEGRNSIPASFGGGEADVELSEFAVGLAIGYKFGAENSLKDD